MIYIFSIFIIAAIVYIVIQDNYIRSWKKKYDLLEEAIRKTEVGVTISDATIEDQPLIYISEGFKQITGYEIEEALNRNCRFLQGANTDKSTVLKIREAVNTGESIQAEILNYRKDGTPFWNEITINPIYRKDKLKYFVGIQKDVTKRKLLELELAKDLLIAKNLQTGLLSHNINNDQIKIEGYLKASIELSGDMYVWKDLSDGRYALLLIDVMGHGIASSMIANSIHVLSKRQMLLGTSPSKAMEHLNEFMFTLFNDNIDQLYFFTGIYLMVDINKNTINYVNAGHMPIVHQKANGKIDYYESTSIPVGISNNMSFEENSFHFNQGDRLLLFTDGFIENSSLKYNDILNKLDKNLTDYNEDPSNHIFDYLLEKHKDMLNHDDDITLVHLYRK